MAKIINLYMDWHLGDSVFNLILFYNIKNYIEDNNIIINYYANKEYLYQLSEFIPSKNINLLENNTNISNKGIHMWIGNKDFKFNYFNSDHSIYNLFYVKFFNLLLEHLEIPLSINNLIYYDNDLLIRYDKLNEKYKNLDILIINSIPLSGQYYYNEFEWINFIQNLNKNFKIVTTKKINNILCTLDDCLTIKNIAALSTQVKIIIAINTGVVPGLLNIYTLSNVRKFYVLDNNCTYYYQNYKIFHHISHINEISENELSCLINKK